MIGMRRNTLDSIEWKCNRLNCHLMDFTNDMLESNFPFHSVFSNVVLRFANALTRCKSVLCQLDT